MPARSDRSINRRRFLRAVGGAAAAWTAWRLARPAAAQTPAPDPAAPWPEPVWLCDKDEPGIPILIRGCVFAPDGVTPAPGVVLYAYHTDATGVYAKPGQPPRLRGWMRSDARGRYAYRTIRPAPYPGREQAAHIHTQLWSADIPPQWGTTLQFADDDLVTARQRQQSRKLGRFGFVRALAEDRAARSASQRGARVQRGWHHLRVSRRGDSFQANTRHGLDGAPAGFAPPR